MMATATSSSPSGDQIDLEEEIIKRRLVTDGDGRGDEKQYRSLLQTYLLWVTTNNPAENDDPLTLKKKKEANEKGLKRFLLQLETVKLIAKKNIETICTVQSTQVQYAELQLKIKEEIINQRKLILELKENSSQRERAQQQKMECEAVIKLLERLPDRKKKEAKVKKLNEELAKLQAQRNEMDCKFDIQKQKLSVLIQTSKDLARIMSEDDVLIVKEDLAKSEVKELAKDKYEVKNLAKDKSEVKDLAKDKSEVKDLAKDKSEGKDLANHTFEVKDLAKNKSEVKDLAKNKPEVKDLGEASLDVNKVQSMCQGDAPISELALRDSSKAVVATNKAVQLQSTSCVSSVGTSSSLNTKKLHTLSPLAKAYSRVLGKDAKIVKLKRGRYQLVNKTCVSSHLSKLNRSGPKPLLKTPVSNAKVQNKVSRKFELERTLPSNTIADAKVESIIAAPEVSEAGNASVVISPSPFMFRTLDTRNIKTVLKPSPAKCISLGDVIRSEDTSPIFGALLADTKHLTTNRDSAAPLASSSSRADFEMEEESVRDIVPVHVSDLLEGAPELAVGYQELLGIKDGTESDQMSLVSDGEDDIGLYDDILEVKNDSSSTEVREMELSKSSAESVEENSAKMPIPINTSPCKSQPVNLITLHYESEIQ